MNREYALYAYGINHKRKPNVKVEMESGQYRMSSIVEEKSQKQKEQLKSYMETKDIKQLPPKETTSVKDVKYTRQE